MESWISSDTLIQIPLLNSGIFFNINGYVIIKPNYFKNKAHTRAFEIALILAEKKPAWMNTQRMGDITITVMGPVIMDTSECIDIIMFSVPKEIQLKEDAVNPRVVAHDAMKFVPSFFENGKVILNTKTKGRRPWYLELTKN